MEHLTLCVLSQDSTDIFVDLTKFATDCDCNIINTWFHRAGDQTITTLNIEGSWNEIAKFETHLEHIEENYNASIIFGRTEITPEKKNALPYTVYITGLNRKGTLHQVTKFFEIHGAILNEIYSDVNYTRKTQTPILSISLHITLPAESSIAEFREQFFLFCDNLNLDGMLEVEKN
ncbi:MAG: hypothetical protein AAGG80_00250 [Pseudomonadota bacterium]